MVLLGLLVVGCLLRIFSGSWSWNLLVLVPAGYKNLVRLALGHMSHFLCPAFQALGNASVHSGVVMRLKVEVVVCVHLLPAQAPWQIVGLSTLRLGT